MKKLFSTKMRPVDPGCIRVTRKTVTTYDFHIDYIRHLPKVWAEFVKTLPPALVDGASAVVKKLDQLNKELEK